MFKSNRKAIRIGSRTLALTGAAAAAALAVGATTSHASSHNDSAATASDTTTVSAKGPTLPAWHSSSVPKMTCPTTHPWLLDQQYNPGSGFRIMPGVEFSNYNPGFDASVWLHDGKNTTLPNGKEQYLYTGTTGIVDYGNSVTNWAFTSSEWTVTIHCTSDPYKGVIQPPRS